MKCSIKTCSESSKTRKGASGPYCSSHDKEIGRYWVFCFSPMCSTWVDRFGPYPRYCTQHGGKDYTPRTEETKPEAPRPEAVKHDQDKPRFDLLDPLSLSVVVKVFTFGAKKYADHNYLLGDGLDHGRVYASIQRHLNAYWRGEDNDPETSLPHLAHAACGAFMLLSLTLRKKGKDTRLKNA